MSPSPTIAPGQTIAFTATVKNSADQTVFWAVNGVTGGETIHGTISSEGVYNAPSAVPSIPTVRVTATAHADTTKSARSDVTIQASTITVVISPPLTSVTQNQSIAFSWQVQNTANTALTWSVDGITGGNANVGLISPAGVYTPPGIAGTHAIRATSQADPGASGVATVAVTDLAGIFTHHFDNARTGQNRQELALTPGTVSAAQFGKLFSFPVDGFVYAQPVYMANLSVPGQGIHNVVYVATEHDSVYAFDADGPGTTPLWRTSLIPPGATTVPSSDVNSTDLVPEIGITGTPVIDPASETLYLVSKTKEPGPVYVQRLHALDLGTGTEKFGGPVAIDPIVAGTGAGTNGTQVAFNTLRQNQRPALLLLNGLVYIGFASHGDNDPYHGWLVVYDAGTLALVDAFNNTPNGQRGGIWQSGGGPAVDESGNIYVTAGNGTFDAAQGGRDYGDSIVKLGLGNGQFSVLDYFAPFNQSTLNKFDQDLGSMGTVVLPDLPNTAHPRVVLIGNKQGKLYLLNRDSLGKFNSASDSQILQSFSVSNTGIFCTPAFWEGSVYLAAINDELEQYPIANGLLATMPVSSSSISYGSPGTTPVVSSNGSSNGVVWALDVSGYPIGFQATLHAYDATNLSHELYRSDTQGNRDAAGAAVKFTVPLVANGKVYVGTQTELTVYGLLP